METNDDGIWYHIRRFIRYTKVLSQDMFESSLKLWRLVKKNNLVRAFKEIVLTIFR